MPELPEVETVVRDLRPLLVGKQIAHIRASRAALRRPWRRDWAGQLIGRCFKEVRRRGKWIIVDFDRGGHLLVHLGMTGQFTIQHATAPIQNHTHIVWTLGGGREHLRFRDIRRFGSVEFFPQTAALDALLDEKLGPEPWQLPRGWRRRFAHSQRCLKAILLDQRVVAGVGNIYADEALFAARLLPTQLGSQTSTAQAQRLRQAVICVLERAIGARGSTIRNYVGGSGLRGGFQEEFAVYGRLGQPCRRCRSAIACIRLAGRSTHYCPKCQRPAALGEVS